MPPMLERCRPSTRLPTAASMRLTWWDLPSVSVRRRWGVSTLCQDAARTGSGRALGAVFPTLVGFLAGSWGLGGAMVLGALAYGLAALALLGLPETRGRDLL